MKRFENRGVWWTYPSYLESPIGPWSNYENMGLGPVSLWKRALDWMADQGLNMICAGIPTYNKDRVKMGWGYHYVLNFDNYPEARVFSEAFTRENLARMNEVFDYARSKGVQPYITHYNFIAPLPFLRAHPHLKEKVSRSVKFEGRRHILDRLGVLWGNVCWSDETYQAFMVACWEEFLSQVPSAAGIMVTPGEYAYCTCEDCNADRPAMVADFVEVFSRTVQRMGRQPLVRTWWSEHLAARLPRGVPYLIKQTVFDCIDAGPDPVINEWLNSGHEVWLTKEFYGENAGPIVWTDPEYFRRMADDAEKLGIRSVFGHHNSDCGYFGYKSFAEAANLAIYAQYIGADKDQPDTDWETYFCGHYGGDGAPVLNYLKAIARVVLNISKIVYSEGEGYTWHMFYPFREAPYGTNAWPSDLGSIHPPHWHPGPHLDPPEWARGDLATIRSYLDAAKSEPWDADFPARTRGALQDPIRMLADLAEKVAGAREAFAPIAKDLAATHEGEIEFLVVSGILAEALAHEWVHKLLAEIYYAAACNPQNSAQRDKLGRLCVNETRLSLGQLTRQMEACTRLPDGHWDFGLNLGIEESSRIWFHSVPTRYHLTVGELLDREAEFHEDVEAVTEIALHF